MGEGQNLLSNYQEIGKGFSVDNNGVFQPNLTDNVNHSLNDFWPARG